DHGAHPGGGLDHLAPAVVLLVAADGEGDALAAQRVEVVVEIAEAAQEEGHLAPGHPLLLVQGAQVGGDRGGLQADGLAAGRPGARAPGGQEGQDRAADQRGGGKPGSPRRSAQGRSGSKGGCTPGTGRSSGPTTRLTSSRMAGTERKFSASGSTSPPAARTR